MSVVDKVIVFDLDETLGYFQDFGILWNSLQIKYSDEVNFDNKLFNSLLNLYPELLRPNIINILEMIVKNQKQSDVCPFLLMIYTNNNGGKDWVNLIIKYFESEVTGLQFNRIINAFKINDKIIEPTRTGHDKKYSDFLRTTKMPKKTRICFIDDVFHPLMENDNIVYIHNNGYKKSPPLPNELFSFMNADKTTNYYIDSSKLNGLVSYLFRYYKLTPDKLINTNRTTIDKVVYGKLNIFSNKKTFENWNSGNLKSRSWKVS
jgi:hypothetical protein